MFSAGTKCFPELSPQATLPVPVTVVLGKKEISGFSVPCQSPPTVWLLQTVAAQDTLQSPLLAVGKRRRFRKNGTFGQSSVWDRVATHQFVSGMSCSIFILLFSCHHTCPRTPPKLPVSQVVTVKLLSCPSAEGRARHLHATCLPQWQHVSRSP